MKIKYGEIKFYSDWLLNNLSLAGKRSRMRVKFIDILAAKQQEFQKFHQALLNEHARKDENNNLIILNPDENGNGQADIIDQEEFNKEYSELTLEEFVIEENESNRDMLTIIKDAIEDCPIEWSGESSLHYEYVCKLFDDIYQE